MNRKQRRAMGATAGGDGGAKTVQFLVGRMASRGTELLAELRQAVGGEPRSGHVVDALMNAAADFERAAVTGDLIKAAGHVVDVLFLARDLAIREGKIEIKPPAQA